MIPHYTRWEKPLAQGGARYYETRVETDLWGTVILTQVWGGRGRAAGQVRHTPIATRDELAEVLQKVLKRRRARLYTLVAGEPSTVAEIETRPTNENHLVWCL